jgi:hypothetical protein
MAARAVLTLLSDVERRRVVGDYVDQGGGLALFLAAESEAFLAYLAPRLRDPSHALTICSNVPLWPRHRHRQAPQCSCRQVNH